MQTIDKKYIYINTIGCQMNDKIHMCFLENASEGFLQGILISDIHKDPVNVRMSRHTRLFLCPAGQRIDVEILLEDGDQVPADEAGGTGHNDGL